MKEAATAQAEATAPRYERIIGVFGIRFAIGSQPDQTNRQHPEYDDYDKVVKVLGSIPGYSNGRVKIVSGGSKGVERLAERWCKECGVPFERFRPDTDNKADIASAFDARNLMIISESTEIMILWDGKQRDFDKLAQAAVVLGKKVTFVPVHK